MKKALSFYLAGFLTASIIAFNADSISKKIAVSEMYDVKPVNYGEQSHFRVEDLGELVNKKIPVRLTDNTIDALPHFSNDPFYVSSSLTRIVGRFFPTHVAQYEKEGNILKLVYVPLDQPSKFDHAIAQEVDADMVNNKLPKKSYVFNIEKDKDIMLP